MKMMLVLAVAAMIPTASALADVPAQLPKRFNIGSTLAMLASAAQQCDLRSPQWTRKVLTAALQGEESMLHHYTGGQPDPAVEREVWNDFAGGVSDGIAFTKDQCAGMDRLGTLKKIDPVAKHGWTGD